jgi:hypothetical protein
MRDEAQARVHEAIGGLLEEGEIAVSWSLTIDVAGPDDTRYLAHRSGGGLDGCDSPLVWHVLGMQAAAVRVTEDQLSDCTIDADGDENE